MSMRTSNSPISSCWSAPISPGVIRCSISASSRPRRDAPKCASSISIRAARRRAKSATRIFHSRPTPMSRCSSACCAISIAPAPATAAYVARHTNGVEAALAAAQQWTVHAVAAATGLDEIEIERLYALFTACERVVTVYSQGVNQSVCGTDKVNAILNCHLFTGRIGKPGSGPFSVTGQPNAMGGREVGGLANQLACHMELDDAQHRAIVQSHWRAPTHRRSAGPQGRRSVRAVHDGQIRALWIIGANPAVSLPEADVVRAALAACPFVVVSDAMEHTDTTAARDSRAAGAGLGREGRNRHQFRAAHLASACAAQGRGRVAARLAHHLPRRDADGFRRLRLRLARRYLPRLCRALRPPQRRRARFRHLRL